MACAIHRTEHGESLAAVAAAYYALRGTDHHHRDGALGTITKAIREATPDAATTLDVRDSDPLPEGIALFVPTLRAFNRIVMADDAKLRDVLARQGFDHARKLLRHTSRQVLALLQPLPAGHDAESIHRMWTLTAFLNLDGMDRYTAIHLYDTIELRSLRDLAAIGAERLAAVIRALLEVPHARPAALAEQRHSERWVLEARALTRKRVSELTKARARLFLAPCAPGMAERKAAFYERAANDDALTRDDATLAGRLARVHRFQEAVLRGNVAIVTGRWSAAVDAYQEARRQWHRLAEETGAAGQVDDAHGMNLKTAVEVTRRVLQALPCDDDDPLGAPPTELRGALRNTAYRLRGFRLEELHAGSRHELQTRLASRRVHQLPRRIRSAVQRAVMDRTRGELRSADATLVDGLVPGAESTLMRDLEARDREVLRRNLGGAAVGVLYAPGFRPAPAAVDTSLPGAAATFDIVRATAGQLAVSDIGAFAPDLGPIAANTAAAGGAGAPLDVFTDAAGQLPISDIRGLVPDLWNDGEPAGALLSDTARSMYPNEFLARTDVGPFTKFLVIPGAAGRSEAFVPLSSSFAEEYEEQVIKPRLISAEGGDIAFDERCWSSAGAFTAIAPYLYSVQVPFGLRQAYARMGRRDLASRYGALRVNVYGSDGTMLRDLATALPSEAVFDIDRFACSSHWVDPTTVEPDFTVYMLDVEDYARWYIRVADDAYRRDDRQTARSWYADVMCAIEHYWGETDLVMQAEAGLTGVRNSIAAIRNGEVNESLQSLSTLNVRYEADGVARKVMQDTVLVTNREPAGGARHRATRHRVLSRSTSRSHGGSEPACDFDAVSVTYDGAFVGRTMDQGSISILVDSHRALSGVYAEYLYCSAKVAAIDAGLNWWGLSASYVPPWSFQHLYTVARDLCNRALDAERHTFSLLQTLEAAEREALQASQVLEMANEALSAAEARVSQQEAANELAWTQAAIAFNQAGLAQAQNSWQGTVDMLTGWVGFVFNPIGSGNQFFSGIGNLTNDVLYEQLTGLAHQAWVETEALNEAALAVAIAERDVAGLHQQQAAEYLEFLEDQTLDVGAYEYLLALSRELTEYYLDHATRLCWLAQRALSHETRQTFRLIDVSYVSGDELLDMTQAQRLTADLESMLATYTAGQTRRHQELKWTVALSQLAPGALRALRSSGTAMFMLPQETVDAFFPGHFLHSLKDVSMTLVGTLPPTGARGVLRSNGVSWVRVPNDGSYEDGSSTREDWTTTTLASASGASRPELTGYRGYVLKMIRSMGSSVSLSQFDVQRDRAVLSVPQGMLSSVQHLGMDTGWTLTLHRQANAFEFSAIQDVELTFWLQAAFDDTLAQAQYEALVRRGLRGELQAAALLPCASEQPDAWAAFVGDAANPDALDLRLLPLDVGGLPPWETVRRTANVMVACAREPGAPELTLRLCCDHDPVGVRLTTVNGAAFSAIDLALTPEDPTPNPDLETWVRAALYGPRGVATADPAVRWVIKADPTRLGGAWLLRDQHGEVVAGVSGPLRGHPRSGERGSAVFNDGHAWTDVLFRTRVRHAGGTLRLRVRHTDAEHYAAEIGPRRVRLLQVSSGIDRVLAARPLSYPPDEYLCVAFGVVSHALSLTIDGIDVFRNVAASAAADAGTVALEVVDLAQADPNPIEFDDVEVVGLTKLGAEAETLLAEPFTSAFPSNWTYTPAGSWSIGPAGLPRLDLRALGNLTLKLDYFYRMVEP